MRRPWIVSLLVVLLVAGATWFWASPGLAMKGLRDAAMNGDREALKDRVDFPAVRESMKSQVKAKVLAQVAINKDKNPFAALGGMFAMAIVDPVIDGMVSPDGIKAMVEYGKVQAKGQVQPQPNAKVAEWEISRNGLERFTATPQGEAAKNGLTLVFIRNGLGWRLVDVTLPDTPDAPDTETSADGH